MEPTRRFVIIIFTLSLLKFQELEGARTKFNQRCAPLFSNLATYQNCGMTHLGLVRSCCAEYASDHSINCKDIMNFYEMEMSLGEKLEQRNIEELHPQRAISSRHIDHAVRYVVDRDHKLRGADAQYYYVPVPLASILIGFRGYDALNEINFVQLAGKILIMPFFKWGHWMVMIAHIHNKVIRYYDSLDPLLQTPTSIQNAYTNGDIFVQMLIARNFIVPPNYYINADDWDIVNAITEPHGILRTPCIDLHCAIYVLMFIEQVLNQQTFTNSAEYREYLTHAIGRENLVFDPQLENRSRYYNPTQISVGSNRTEVPSCAS